MSQLFDAGESYRPDYAWGGSHATEVVDDGDGAIDEDPVDLVDAAADGLVNEDDADDVDNDGDGLIDEDGPDGQRDNDGDGLLNEDGRPTGVFSGTPFSRRPTHKCHSIDLRAPSRRVSLRRDTDSVMMTTKAASTAQRGSNRHGDTGYGQIVDGDIHTSRTWTQRTENTGFRVELLGTYQVDLLRIRPRPGFADRSPSPFQIHYSSDSPNHVQTRLVNGSLQSRLLVNDFIIPQQVDQVRPAIKEFRFDGGEFGHPPTCARSMLRGDMDSGVPWEITEFEVFGSGYSHEASLVSEIVDLGQSRPVVHRFFDAEDPTRPVPFESFSTHDIDGDKHIDIDELVQSALRKQVDLEASGQSIIPGDVRYRLQAEGDGHVHLRIRSGTSPHTRIYQRGTSPESQSPFVDDSIVLDWPQPGTRLDAYSYAALSEVQRATFKTLPMNEFGSEDGIGGGWTSWSPPLFPSVCP